MQFLLGHLSMGLKAGGGSSLIRTLLRGNSLLTGKFTGNLLIFRPHRATTERVTLTDARDPVKN